VCTVQDGVVDTLNWLVNGSVINYTSSDFSQSIVITDESRAITEATLTFLNPTTYENLVSTCEASDGMLRAARASFTFNGMLEL